MLKLLYIALLLPLTCFSQDFYERLNMYREHQKRSPLQRDSSLEVECERWLKRTEWRSMVHDYRSKHAEVLAENGTDPLHQWVYSPPHNAILLDKFSYVGFVTLGKRSCARFK